MKIPLFYFTVSLPLAAACLFFGMPSAMAEQGVVITARQAKSEENMVTKKMGFPPANEWKTITIFVARNKVRMDSGDGGIIYRADQKKVYILLPKSRNYHEVTEAFLMKGQQRVNQAMVQLRQQMAAMPPAQRKMMEQMLKQRGVAMGSNPAKKPGPSYRRGKRGIKIGQWRCDMFSGRMKGKKVSDICIARLSNLGLKRNDLAILNKLEKLFDRQRYDMSRGAGDISLAPDKIRAMAGFDGFPVRTVEYKDYNKQVKTVLQRIEHKSIPASVFEVPKGYTKASMGR
ncbi:MAG: DUF4412 domain-containing protein [bacterium]